MNYCSGLATHFQKNHSNQKDPILDETYKKIKFRKYIPPTTVVGLYTYTCYICSVTFKHPTFKKHFKYKHPEETYDRSRIIETKGTYDRLLLIMHSNIYSDVHIYFM